MYCPRCRAQYRDGFYDCADCRVPLVATLPALPVEDHNPALVTVLQTEDTFALRLAEAALDDAGIEYLVNSQDELRQSFRGIFGLNPDLVPYQTCRIQVRAERAAEARAILEPLEHPSPSGAAEPEPDGAP